MASIVPLYELRVGSRTYLVPLSSLQNSTNDSGSGKGKKKKQKNSNSSNNSAATAAAAAAAAATATTVATTEEAPLVYIQQQPQQQIIQHQIAPPPQHQPVTIQTIPHHQEVNNEVSIVQHHVEPATSFAVNHAGEIQLHHVAAPSAAAAATATHDVAGASGAEVPGVTKYPLVKARCPFCPRIFDYGAKLKKHAFEAHGKGKAHV